MHARKQPTQAKQAWSQWNHDNSLREERHHKHTGVTTVRTDIKTASLRHPSQRQPHRTSPLTPRPRHRSFFVYLHGQPVGFWVLTHCTHSVLVLGRPPPQEHCLSHLQPAGSCLQVPQSEYGHALAIASFTCAMVMVPHWHAPAAHSHFFSDDAQEQSAHWSQPQLMSGGAAALVAMAAGRWGKEDNGQWEEPGGSGRVGMQDTTRMSEQEQCGAWAEGGGAGGDTTCRTRKSPF